MSLLTQAFKHITPAPLWDAARAAWYGLGRASQWPAATFHPWRRQSFLHLARLKDVHSGERCFIIGNGPSLKQTDLSRLSSEYTFGMNRIYLLFPEMGFTTNYYLSVNSLVIEQCADDILALPVPKFLSWRSHHLIRAALPSTGRLPDDPPLAFLHTTYTGPRFARDARQRLWEGATVTYVALQLAFHMGFQQAILVGVDHSFATQGRPNTTVISQGDDPDHFDAGYFGRGFRWQLPDLDTSESGYALARQAYEQDGRQVLDATIGGKLSIFPKADFNTLF